MRFIGVIILLLVVGSCGVDDSADDGNEIDEGPSTAEEWDLNKWEIPRFLGLYMSGEPVRRISKFRSGVGHDYSDDFEECRSMKHYFDVPESTEVYSPLAGKVIWLSGEWTGVKVMIRSSDYPAFLIELFHMDLEKPLAVGDEVGKGQLLGYHSSANTSSDIAIMLQTNEDGPVSNDLPRSNGTRLISYFDCLEDDAFEELQASFNGKAKRTDYILSKETRDAEIFDCDRDWSLGGEREYYWVYDLP